MRRLPVMPLLAIGAGALAACSDGTAPQGDRRLISIELCDHQEPLWLAYRNEDEPWTRLEVRGEREITFEATPLVTFAYV